MHAETRPDPTEAWLRSLVADARTADLVVACLARAIRRERIRTPVEDPGTADRILHVVDWIVAAVLSEEAWLSRTDALGRPLKLLKIGSIDRAVREADKAMRRAASAVAVRSVGDDVHRTLAEGWTLARLATPEALDAESSAMGHCIGAGSYDARLLSGDHLYLSLRDPAGAAHATLEIRTSDRLLLQLQGKRNRPPVPRHAATLRPFLEAETSFPQEQARRWGYVRARDGALHLAGSLPDDLDVEGDLVLDLRDGAVRLPSVRVAASGTLDVRAGTEDAALLPPVLTAGGCMHLSGRFAFASDATVRASSLFARGVRADTLPDGLAVPDILDLTDARVDRLPAGLRAGTLVLASSSVAEIPADARIGTLDLRWTGVETLPDGFHAKNLHLENASLTALPDGLTVEGDVRIVNSPVLRFGRGTRIGGDLLLRDVPPALDIPPDAEIVGALELRGFTPERYPEGLRVGSLRVRNAACATLPERLSLAGDLVVHHSAIRRMPSSIEVAGQVDWFVRTAIDLPDRLRVGGDAYFASGRRVRFGRDATIGGTLDLSDAKDVSLSQGLVVGGDLVVNPMVGLTRLPGRISIGGSFAAPFALERLAGRMRVGSLDLSATRVTILPGKLRVAHDLVLHGCGVEDLPDDLVVGGILRVPDRFDLRRLPPGIDPSRVRQGTWEGDAVLDAAYGRAGRETACPLSG